MDQRKRQCVTIVRVCALTLSVDSWFLYDDDKVSRVADDDIKKLTGSGGSDWHLAYICVYKAKRLSDAAAALDKNDEEKN